LKLYGDLSGNLDELRAHVQTYQGIYQATAPMPECLQVPHVTSPVPDYRLQESSMSTLSLPNATLFGRYIWSLGFHYDGQTGEAFACQTQELLSV